MHVNIPNQFPKYAHAAVDSCLVDMSKHDDKDEANIEESKQESQGATPSIFMFSDVSQYTDLNQLESKV